MVPAPGQHQAIGACVVSYRYSIAYEVIAASRLDAITQAVGKLRTDVRLRSVGDVVEVTPGFWKVSLHVDEDS